MSSFFSDKLSAIYNKFRELQGSPAYLAKGVAVGVFIAFAPLSPLKTLLILALTFLIQSSTVAALLTCATICNPLTYIPLYYFAWVAGNFLLPGRVTWQMLESTVMEMQKLPLSESLLIAGRLGVDTALVLFTGGLLIALPLAFLSYPFALNLFVKVVERREKKVLTK